MKLAVSSAVSRVALATTLLAFSVSSCFCLDLAALLDEGAFDIPDGGAPPSELPRNAIVIDEDDLEVISACLQSTQQVSDAKLDEAFATYATRDDGTVEVELTDDGCQRFSRTLEGGVLREARFTKYTGMVGLVLQGEEIVHWAQVRTEAEWTRGADGVIVGRIHDGASVSLDPDAEEPFEVEILEDHANRTRQTTRFSSNGDVAWRVTIVGSDTGSVQTLEHDVDGEWVTETTVVKPESRAQSGDCNEAGVTCEDDKAAVLDAALESALKRGTKCLQGLARDRDDTWMRYVLLKDRWTRAHSWGCLPTGCGIARWCDTCQDGGDPLNIDIDYDAWSARQASDPTDAESILFHEMMHGLLGYHSDTIVNSSIYDETTRRDRLMRRYTDRVNACQAYCFAPTPAQVTKCSCAVCLDTKVCDDRCSGLATCREDQFGSPIMSEAVGTACVTFDPSLGTQGEEKATWFNTKAECQASSCEEDGGRCDSKSVSCDEGCE